MGTTLQEELFTPYISRPFSDDFLEYNKNTLTEEDLERGDVDLSTYPPIVQSGEMTPEEWNAKILPEEPVEKEGIKREEIIEEEFTPYVHQSDDSFLNQSEEVSTIKDILEEDLGLNQTLTQQIKSGRTEDLNKYLHKNFPYDITKEEVLADDFVYENLIQSLEARYQPGLIKGTLSKRVSGGLGGATGTKEMSPFNIARNYREMPRKDVFEIWQNWQRSFDAGHSVTASSDLLYLSNVDDDTKYKVGNGYVIQNHMTNALWGRGTWPETGDAITDAMTNLIWDVPANAATLIAGRIIQKPLAKGVSYLAKKGILAQVKGYVAKGLTVQQAKDQIRRQFLNKIKTAATSDLAQRSLAYGLPASVVNGTLDAIYQVTKLETGAQKEWSKIQTFGTVTAPLLLMPAGVYGHKVLKDFRIRHPEKWYGWKQLDDKFIKEGLIAVEKEQQKIINTPAVRRKILATFNIKETNNKLGVLDPDKTDKFFDSWELTKSKSKAVGKRDTELFNQFMHHLLFGKADDMNADRGLVFIFEDAGVSLHAAQIKKGDNITNVYAQLFKMLDQKTVTDVVNVFQKETGTNLRKMLTGSDDVTTPITGEMLANLTVRVMSDFGTSGSILSRVRKFHNNSFQPDDRKARALAKNKLREKKPKVFKYLLSNYKKLLTAALPTTGENIKGYGFLNVLDATSDIVASSINASRGFLYKILDNPAAQIPQRGGKSRADVLLTQAWGESRGTARKFLNIFTPELPTGYAETILNLSPAQQKILLRYISGGVAEGRGKYASAFEEMNMPEVFKYVDNTTNAIQTISLLRLQDTLTKHWSFAGLVDQKIMEIYGKTPGEFFDTTDPGKMFNIMMSNSFREKVLDPAVTQTVKLTASVDWTQRSKYVGTFWAEAAKQMERLSNNAFFGYQIPFGSFANTVVHNAGSYTGINFGRRLIHRGLEVKGITGRDGKRLINPFDESDTKLFAQGFVGLALMGYYLYGPPGKPELGEMYKLENGIAVDQDLQSDGSMTSSSTSWPKRQFKLGARVIAHMSQKYNGDVSQIPIEELKFGPINEIFEYYGFENPEWNIRNWKDYIDKNKPFQGQGFSNVPVDLWKELFNSLGGSNYLNIQKIQDVYVAGIIKSLKDGDFSIFSMQKTLSEKKDDFLDLANVVIMPPVSRVVQGATRFAELENTITRLIFDNESHPDYGGYNKSYYGMFKYIDNLIQIPSAMGFGEGIGPDRIVNPVEKQSVSGENVDVSIPKLLFSNRLSQENNMYMSMWNSAGKPPWKAGGTMGRDMINAPVELRNMINEALRNELHYVGMQKIRDLDKLSIDYFKLHQNKDPKGLGFNKKDILNQVQKEAVDNIKTGLLYSEENGNGETRFLDAIELMKKDKKDIEYAIEIAFNDTKEKPKDLDDIFYMGGDWDIDTKLIIMLKLINGKIDNSNPSSKENENFLEFINRLTIN
tara:strand:+ start:254 stop:4585 length:4332 start_codon:yes stop_codon:yes gene_type:complete